MKATFNNFEITATYTGSKPAPWGDTMPKNWNHYRITVKNTNNGKRTGFDFWASIAKPKLTTEHDVLDAFRCFINDALAGEMDFTEFCGELGYDEDSRTAERTWKACKRSANKLRRIYDGDLYELINSLENWA